MLNGFFDIHFRLDELKHAGDPLIKINEIINWELFRSELEKIYDKERKTTAGRKHFDVVLMFKILILQNLYNLSHENIEFHINDRLSFMRFLNLNLDDKVPDAKTIWLFEQNLTKLKLTKKLFKKFDEYLRKNGFKAREGQIVDASIVSVPKQRNKREENAEIKEGKTPEDWNDKKRSHKDTDARWVKKNGKSFYGFKNHVQVDVKHKFVRDYEVSDAALHDSNIFEEILDETNSNKDVYADSAYQSKETVDSLKSKGFRPKIQRKGKRNKPLTNWEKQGNRTRSKTRCRVEHIFGVQAMTAGNLLLRSIGIKRAKTKIGLRNLAYNLKRYATLVSTAKN